jgi:hypothetical protein
MSIKAMNWAMAQMVGGPSGKVVLMAYADYADENGVCWPAINTIAKITEQSRATVQRRLRDFEKIGIITRRERTRDDGSQTSDEITLQMHVSANVSAAESDEEGVSNCNGGIADTDTPPVAGSDTGPVSLVQSPYDPSLEHPKEPKPLNPLSPTADPPLRVIEVKVPERFDEFFAGYPGSRTMDRRRAAAEFAKLTDAQQAAALKAVPLLAAELEKQKRKPKDAHRWLKIAGYELFEGAKPEPAPVPAFVFVADHTENFTAWDIYYRVIGGPKPTVRWSEENQARGMYAGAAWPPFGRGCDPNEANWPFVEFDTRQWWAWNERLAASGRRLSPRDALGPVVTKLVEGQPVVVMEGPIPKREWRKRGLNLPGDPNGWPPTKAQSLPPNVPAEVDDAESENRKTG